MSNFITVMAKTLLLDSEELTAWKVQSNAILFMRDRGTYEVFYHTETGVRVSFRSPIVEIGLPGMRLYASGVVDELEARTR